MIVIKIGGAKDVSIDKICEDIAGLTMNGKKVVLVHGGSHETNQLSEKLGHPAVFITSPSGYTSRYTDRQTLEIFAMTTNGLINTKLVEKLQSLGVNALGLSGLDGRLMQAERKKAIRSLENGRVRILRDDYTGRIESVNTLLLHTLLENGFTPVIAPLALSYQGEALNVDADRAAAMIAGSLNAEQLILLSNVPGLMRSFPDTSTLISKIQLSGLEQALSFAEGRMKKKVLGASEALIQGAGHVIFADGRIEGPVTRALEGHGTVITHDC